MTIDSYSIYLLQSDAVLFGWLGTMFLCYAYLFSSF